MDIGDWFRYEIGPTRSLSEEANGIRFPVDAFIGATNWCSFHVDLVDHGARLTGEPDRVSPIAQVSIPDIEQCDYRVYPLVDHITDKIVATLRRYGPTSAPSTRYRDLIDLVAIVTSCPVDAIEQTKSLHTEVQRRNLALPDYFDAPDRDLWTRGYAAEAAKSTLTTASRLDEALEIIQPFIHPLFKQSAIGIWNPTIKLWQRQ